MIAAIYDIDRRTFVSHFQKDETTRLLTGGISKPKQEYRRFEIIRPEHRERIYDDKKPHEAVQFTVLIFEAVAGLSMTCLRVPRSTFRPHKKKKRHHGISFYLTLPNKPYPYSPAGTTAALWDTRAFATASSFWCPSTASRATRLVAIIRTCRRM